MRAQYAPDGTSLAQYRTIWFTDDAGVTISVPEAPANTDYQKIMQLVAEGKLTIAPAAGE